MPRTLRLRKWQRLFRVPRRVRSGPGLPHTKVDARCPSAPPTSRIPGNLWLPRPPAAELRGPRSTAPAAQARERNGCPALSTGRAGRSGLPLGSRAPGCALLAPRHPMFPRDRPEWGAGARGSSQSGARGMGIMVAAAPRPEGVSAKASPRQACGSRRHHGPRGPAAVLARGREVSLVGEKSLGARLVHPCCLFPFRVVTCNVHKDVDDKPIKF